MDHEVIALGNPWVLWCDSSNEKSFWHHPWAHPHRWELNLASYLRELVPGKRLWNQMGFKRCWHLLVNNHSTFKRLNGDVIFIGKPSNIKWGCFFLNLNTGVYESLHWLKQRMCQVAIIFFFLHKFFFFCENSVMFSILRVCPTVGCVTPGQVVLDKNTGWASHGVQVSTQHSPTVSASALVSVFLPLVAGLTCVRKAVWPEHFKVK